MSSSDHRRRLLWTPHCQYCTLRIVKLTAGWLYLPLLVLCKCPGQDSLEKRPHEVLMVHVTDGQVRDVRPQAKMNIKLSYECL
jgi:hypothetical protein